MCAYGLKDTDNIMHQALWDNRALNSTDQQVGSNRLQFNFPFPPYRPNQPDPVRFLKQKSSRVLAKSGLVPPPMSRKPRFSQQSPVM